MSESYTHEHEALLPPVQARTESSKHLINLQSWLKPSSSGERGYVQSSRSKAKRFLSSKAGHYSVLTLVVLDVGCIFAGTLAFC
jgi:hypothetical protein